MENMFLGSNNITLLEENFRKISNNNSNVIFQLWILELLNGDKKEQILLYGWINNTSFSESKISFKELINDKNHNYHILKLTFIEKSIIIFNLLKNLLEGFNIKDCCKNLNIEFKNEDFNFNLEKSKEQIEKKYIVRPIIFQPPKDTETDYILNSPSSKNGAYVLTIFCLEKSKFLLGEEITKTIIKTLEDETGFHFKNKDSSRLGNIEWFEFPSANTNDISYVSIKAIRTDLPVKLNKNEIPPCRSLEVSIDPKKLSIGTNILVRTRLINGRAIILDECKETVISNNIDRIKLLFTSSEEISEFAVNIWIKNKEIWSLWYEYSIGFIRSIGIEMGIAGSSGTIDSNRMSNMNNKKKLFERIEKVKKFQRIESRPINIETYSFDPWSPSINNIEKEIKRLYPKKSKSQFFEKGWFDESGLNFREWFKNLVKNGTNISKVLIIDPYFDTEGIEILSGMKYTNVKYVAISNTQSIENWEKRIEKLKKSCNESDLALSDLDFSLLDLQKTNKEKLLHDRYIVLINKNNQIEEAFNLSNSIQAATKNFPLLITSIPEDIFFNFQNYIYDLLDSDIPKDYKLVTIYSSKESNLQKNIPYKEALKDISLVNNFFSIIFNNKDFLVTSFEELNAYLIKNNVINKSESFLNILNNLKITYKELFLNLINHDSFSELWVVFSELLSHSVKEDEIIKEFCILDNSNLIKNLENFLLSALEEVPPYGIFGLDNDKEAYNILNLLLEKDFSKLLKITNNYLNYPSSIRNKVWSVYYAIVFLINAYPQKLLDILYKNISSLNNSNIDNKNVSLSIFSKYSISLLIEKKLLFSQDLVNLFLKSSIPFIRVLGIQSLISNPIQSEEYVESNIKTIITSLSILDKKEFLLSLSEIVYEIRIQANRNDMKETDKLKSLRNIIFQEIIKNYFNELSKDEIRYCINRFSGPAEGAWAETTSNDFFIPLIEKKLANYEILTSIWFDILFEHLENGFSALSDSSLTETCAWFLANLNKEKFTIYFKKIEKRLKYCKYIVEEPFSRTKDFSKWENARSQLLWLSTLLKIIKFYVLQENNLDIQVLENEIKNLDKFILLFHSEKIISRDLEKYYLETDKRLKEVIK